MKKAILHFLWLIVLVMSISVKAQTVCQQITNHYPASVISRVYEVASKINVTPDKQLLLARYFQKEDSLVARAVINGATPGEIASIRTLTKNDFINIFTSAELDSYYTAMVNEDAMKESKIMALMAREKYGCDTATERKLYKLFYVRNSLVEKTCLRYSGSPKLDSVLSVLIVKLDTITDKYLSLAQSNAYFNRKIALLDSIKPLTQKEKVRLSIYFNLNKKSKDGSLADHFNEALHKVVTDTVYYASLYRKEISQLATLNSGKEILDISIKNQPTNEGMKSLFPIVSEKERKLATINFAFPTYTMHKDSLIRKTTARYDSLINVALMRDGSQAGKSQFDIALKNRKSLGLTNAQVDSLVSGAAMFNKLNNDYSTKDPDGKIDPKAFESDNMSKILTEAQYTKVLVVKNNVQAKNDALRDWKELGLRNIKAGYDSTIVVKQLTTFYLAKYAAYDRYGNDRIKQIANLNAVAVAMPEPLKKLNAARKRNTAVTNQATKGNYQW